MLSRGKDRNMKEIEECKPEIEYLIKALRKKETDELLTYLDGGGSCSLYYYEETGSSRKNHVTLSSNESELLQDFVKNLLQRRGL